MGRGMRVVGLDGKEHLMKLGGHNPLGGDQRPRSKGHRRARELLGWLFPCEPRLEEVPLPGSNGLFADFFLPSRKLLVEVHGRQHYYFVPHFHQTKMGFLSQRARDQNKQEWCRLNHVTYVELPDHEPDDVWATRIRRAAFGETGPDSG